MFLYVTTHFVNHSLGLVSLELMDRALERIYKVWASDLGTLALYGAFSVHYCLALWALWLRRSLKMPFAEALQLVLGFCIPFILTAHVLHTRVADTYFGADFGYYSTLLYNYYVIDPWAGPAAAHGAGDRLGPRGHRAAVLAAPQAVVRALAAAVVRLRAADADPRDPRLRRGRPRGHRHGRPIPRGSPSCRRRTRTPRPRTWRSSTR